MIVCDEYRSARYGMALLWLTVVGYHACPIAKQPRCSATQQLLPVSVEREFVG